jgi:hypothetical protein
VFDSAFEGQQEASRCIAELRSASGEEAFLDRFNAFIAAAQTVLIAMLHEGRGERLPGFSGWYAAKREEMADDELMEIVREARDHDFDDGPHRLRFERRARGDASGGERYLNPRIWWPMPGGTLHAALDNAPGTREGH